MISLPLILQTDHLHQSLRPLTLNLQVCTHTHTHRVYVLPCSYKDIFLPTDFNNIIEFKKRNGEMINILAKMGADYYQFGLKLLEDNDGNIMEDIIENCNGKPGRIKRQIVIDWVRGKGKKPITWETLAEVVSKMGLAVLAKDIREATTGNEAVFAL